ncbi:excisionase family DNA binding protein [Bradyrhizobium japonicum]
MNRLKHYRAKELTTLLGISKSTLYSWIRNGHFPRPKLVGPQTSLFSEEEVLAWSEQSTSFSQNATGRGPAFRSFRVASKGERE